MDMENIDLLRLFPQYWFQVFPTGAEWDETLNKLLDKYGVTKVTKCTCMVGPVEVWAENYPYAFGYIYHSDRDDRLLPKVSTRIRLRRMVEDAKKKDRDARIAKRLSEIKAALYDQETK